MSQPYPTMCFISYLCLGPSKRLEWLYRAQGSIVQLDLS